jgi:hypothetical protein
MRVLSIAVLLANADDAVLSHSITFHRGRASQRDEQSGPTQDMVHANGMPMLSLGLSVPCTCTLQRVHDFWSFPSD